MDDRATNTSIAHQQVAAVANNLPRQLCLLQNFQGNQQIVPILRLHKEIGRTANAPGGMTTHRLRSQHFAAEGSAHLFYN